MINVRKVKAAGLCDCCDQIYLCESCLKKLSGKIAKQLQNEGD